MNPVLCQKAVPADELISTSETIALTYDARFLRRRVLTAHSGLRFLVDLPHTTSVNHADGFALADGRVVKVLAADEDLLEVTGDGLVRIAWHIGNRHTPCQIETDRLLIQRDHVMRSMLEQLGARVRDVTEPFTPEIGAYGHGRTHGHDHSAEHGPTHDHAHDHAH